MKNSQKLIHSDESLNSKYSEHILNDYYNKLQIPPEKKPYLSELKNSYGPLVSVETSKDETAYILDAASQIATLGLGFNAGAKFGCSQHLETWTNDFTSPNLECAKKSFHNLIARKLNTSSKDIYLRYCHSGAEANEIALGEAYNKRVSKKQKSVLAFEGSFHGRMQIALSSTWNPVKRAAFEWKDYLTSYLPYPDNKSGEILLEIPKGWHEHWSKCMSKKFNALSIANQINEELLKLECEVLSRVIKSLKEEKYFAIIIEPIQCEGGDKYSTNRFHHALNIIAKNFKVPVIYDEVQSGYHLGREFFWHQYLLQGLDQAFAPSFVTCAKKAQIGLVISKTSFTNNSPAKEDEFNIASFYRGYYQALMMDQNHLRILDLEKKTAKLLKSFVTKHSNIIHSPRQQGMAFSFDLFDKELVPKIVAKRFDYGLLFYPAGSHTLRFRTNLSYRQDHLHYLFNALSDILASLTEDKIDEGNTQVNLAINENEIKNSLKFNDFFINYTTTWLCEKNPIKAYETHFKQFSKWLEVQHEVVTSELTSANFDQYQDQIEELEKLAYEPIRRTDVSKFKKAVSQKGSLSLLFLDKKFPEKIIGMCLSSPINTNPYEYGNRMDPHFNDQNRLYVLDSTITPTHSGKQLGKYLKFAYTLLCHQKGIIGIHGRTRDKIAGQMLNINCAHGAIVSQYIPFNYDDQDQYCDVNYYSYSLPTKLMSQEKELGFQGLSNWNNHHYPKDCISELFVNNSFPSLINKMCMSNFVSHHFLKNLEHFKTYVPNQLSHFYTTSGQSECVDKIIKSIWYKNTENQNIEIKNQSPKPRFISFKGHFFGNGSFLSRSLSGIGDKFFKTKLFKNPTVKNYQSILADIEKYLKKHQVMAAFVEPLPQHILSNVPREFLLSFKNLCQKYNVKLVYNETNSKEYRYIHNNFFASHDKEISPDAFFSYLGGQIGLCCMSKNLFIDKPLTLISTWDGDDYSLAQYINWLKYFHLNKDMIQKESKLFVKNFNQLLKEYDISPITQPYGIIKNKLPLALRSQLKLISTKEQKYILNPSFAQMQAFNSSFKATQIEKV